MIKKFNVLKRAANDMMKIMPGMTIALIILKLLNSLFVVWQVAALASLVDQATLYLQGGENTNIFIRSGIEVMVCYAVLNLIPIVQYKIERIDSVPRHEIWHNIMSEHMAEMSLEETLDPSIFDRYWRAKQALWQAYVTEAFLSFFNIVPILIQLFGVALVLAKYHFALILVALLSVIPATLVSFVFNKKVYDFNHKQAAIRRRAEYLWRLLTKKETIREARIFSFASYISKKYEQVHKEDYEASATLGFKQENMLFLANIIKISLYALAIILTIYFISSRQISVGAFAACLTSFTAMQEAASSLLNYSANVSNYCTYAGDYYEFLNGKVDLNDGTNDISSVKSICANNISYSYPQSENPAVNQVNITLDDKGLYVVVGENGSGKSTLSRLLLNLYEPSNGSITINGLDINSYSKKASRKAFSLMAQDFGKYCISFYENIGISDLERIDDNNSKDLLIEDLDLSYLVNEIGGGNTVLGIDFGGKELSGGEWQKLALARALFKECDLFIFDEPSSAIDPLIENKILSKIAKLAEEKICFVISHRVGICKQAKRIFVMKNGELVQEGTHHELLEKNGIYKELWNAQAKWYVE